MQLSERAQSFMERNLTDSAVFYYNMAVLQYESENDFNNQAGTLNTLGNIYLSRQDLTRAIEFFIASAEIYERKTDNRKALSRPLINIAVIKAGLGNAEAALEYAKRGVLIAEEFEEEMVIVFTRRLIGRIYRTQKMHEESIREIRTTIPWYFLQEDWFNLSESYQGISNNYYDLGDFPSALLFSDSALFFSRKIKDPKGIAYAMHSKAFSLSNLQQLELAKLFSDSSIYLAKQISDPYLIMDGYLLNSTISRNMNDIDAFHEYFILYIQQRDSIEQTQTRTHVAELEARYQNRVKQAEIEVLQLEQQLMISNIRRQKNMRNGISFTLLLVVGFSAALVNRYRLLNKTRRQLELERLRNEIASDLHDDLGSTLSSINIISQMALQSSANNSNEPFAKISQQSSVMMERLSDIVWSVHPGNDTMEQLIVKMREFASEILEPAGISWKFRVDKQICGLKPDLERRKALFLVFKEAVNNLAKYSHANQVNLEMQLSNDGKLQMVVEDQGTGFDPALVKNGNGLQNMKQRAEKAGGKLTISSLAGEGTKVQLTIPIT